MDSTNPYHSSRETLLREIDEARAIVNSTKPLHDDPVEDSAIRGIWTSLLRKLERMNGSVRSE